MRDVTIEEVFTWREEFGLKAKEAFGAHHCDASPETCKQLRARCDKIIEGTVAVQPYLSPPLVPPLNGMMVHAVDGIPDGILRACNCKPQEVR